MPYPFSKEELRKMYGYIETTDPPDPAVVARRETYEKALRWMDKYQTPLLASGFLIGFFAIFLPAILPSWRAIIAVIPVLNIFPNLLGWHGLSVVGRILVPCYFIRIGWREYSPSRSKYEVVSI